MIVVGAEGPRTFVAKKIKTITLEGLLMKIKEKLQVMMARAKLWYCQKGGVKLYYL